MMLGSFMIMYCIFTLFGTYQIYKDIRKTGCDPLGVILDNEACPNTAASVFGALMGIAFAAQGASQVGNFFLSLCGNPCGCWTSDDGH
jgi:ATP-binding cassette subfamily B (MDR/TAP) protein 1